MKIFVALLVLLSTVCGLNAHCVRNQNCERRIFPEPPPKEVHYIYQGETCGCPKYHDIVVEKPIAEPKQFQQPSTYEYNIEVSAKKPEEDVTRYLFDVRVEKPIENTQERRLEVHDYQVQDPKMASPAEEVRYIFDSRVERPVEPCKSQPWEGLVAQVDRVVMPARGCQNADHPENCDCGCRNPSHTHSKCTCGNDYRLPIIFNSRYDTKHDESQASQVFTFPDSLPLPEAYETASRKVKREAIVEKKSKSKRREIVLPKLRSLRKSSSKNPAPIIQAEFPLQPLKSSKKSKLSSRQSRPKRKPDSPCGYTYESCDPKQHNRDGCPLCYKCKCEPVTKQSENQKFSPYDIKVPYKLVTHDEVPGSAPTRQEFDSEPSSYTGLKEQDMYKKYIKQIVSKYPEHMSRKMPDLQEQQKDLLKFVDELSKSNKSPGKQVENEDVRYKIMDNAMDMYKYYEKAVSSMPKAGSGSNSGKFFKKRGTVLEVIELDPDEYDSGSVKYAPADDFFSENYSESQYEQV